MSGSNLLRAVESRVFRKPDKLLRMAGQFADGGIGRTFQYKNHPASTHVTITRARLKKPGVGRLWGIFTRPAKGGAAQEVVHGVYDGRKARERKEVEGAKPGLDTRLHSTLKPKWVLSSHPPAPVDPAAPPRGVIRKPFRYTETPGEL